MNYQLKLEDGSTVDLSFSMYFLNRVCKLTGHGLSSIFGHLLGDMSEIDGGIVTGGLLDDLEIRAAVVAAGIEAKGFDDGAFDRKTVFDGFGVMMKVKDSLTSTIWADMYKIITDALIATLPKDEIKKKPVAKKAVRAKK